MKIKNTILHNNGAEYFLNGGASIRVYTFSDSNKVTYEINGSLDINKHLEIIEFIKNNNEIINERPMAVKKDCYFDTPGCKDRCCALCILEFGGTQHG